MQNQRSSQQMYTSNSMPFSLPKINKLQNNKSIKNQLTQRSRKNSFYLSSRYNQTNKNIHNFSQYHNQNTSKIIPENESASKNKALPNSIYVNHIHQQITPQIINLKQQDEYNYTDTTDIQKEHYKLKNLLKYFNEQTVNILEKYIDKPVKKVYQKNKKEVKQINYIRQIELQNSNNFLIILKNEIQKLEARCENLKYMSKQEFQIKIKELKQDEKKIIMENKELSRQITLNGLEIVKGKQSEVKQLQYEIYLLDTKRDKLKKDTQNAKQQTLSLGEKIKQINNQISEYEMTQNYSLKEKEENSKLNNLTKLQEDFQNKKKIYEHMKIMFSSATYQLKHQYFQKLKELEGVKTKGQQNEAKHKEFEDGILSAKQKISEMQKKQELIALSRKNVPISSVSSFNISKNIINLNQNINSSKINIQLNDLNKSHTNINQINSSKILMKKDSSIKKQQISQLRDHISELNAKINSKFNNTITNQQINE